LQLLFIFVIHAQYMNEIFVVKGNSFTAALRFPLHRGVSSEGEKSAKNRLSTLDTQNGILKLTGASLGGFL